MTVERGRGGQDGRVWVLVGLLLALATAVHTWVASLPATPPPVVGTRVAWLVLVGAFLLAEACVVHVRWGRETHTFGLGEIPLVLGLFVASPVGLVTARLLGAGAALVLYRRQSLLKVSFNLAQWWLGTGLTVLLWRAAIDLAEPLGPRSWAAAVGATLVTDLLASVAILVAIALRGMRVDARLAWTSLWTGAVPAAANACFALVALDVLLVDWRGGWALLVVAAFLGVAQRGHVRLQRRHDSLERLNAFGAGLANHFDVLAVVDGVLRGTADLLEAEECELRLTREAAGSAVSFRLVGGTVVRSDLAGDAPLPEATPRLGRRFHPSVQVPALTQHLVDHRGITGALTVSGRLGEVGGFGEDDLRLLRGVVGPAGAALANGRLADRLREQVRENEYQALHDALTGLPNRVQFDRAVTAALEAEEPLSVLLLDLDRFKEVNDTLGHAAGDSLLREAGDRIRAAVPDATLVARLGGDEFVVVLRGKSRERALRCAHEIREALLHPMVMEAVTLSVDASVGISFAPDQGRDTQSLLRHADVAMYGAKSSRSGAEVYVPESDLHTSTRLSLVGELRDGIREGQLEVWYQPKALLSNGSVRSVEALVRWRHPERGLIPPDDFIPVAEQTGLIDALTDRVMDEALRQCSAWARQGLPLAVAVNISTRTLRREAFPADIRAALARHGVGPEALTLEITESAMMEDPLGAGARLRELRALGVRVSVDDFGTGYSSLANLKSLPVDEVKIDKSFVRNLVEDDEDEAIVAAIIQLVHRLGLSVVAEGVETEAIRDRLALIGCDVAQGYLLSRPLDATALEAWFASRAVPALPVQRTLRSVPSSDAARVTA